MTSSTGGAVDDASTRPLDRPAVVLPPESPSSAWTRRLIILSFWVVIVALGLPHWIWTTSTHRSQLPLESMNAWAEGKACQLRYPLYIRLSCSDKSVQNDVELAGQVQDLLSTQKLSPLYEYYVTADGSKDSTSSFQHHDADQPNYKETALTVFVHANSKSGSTEASLRSWSPIMDISHNPGRSVDKVTLAPFIANEIRKIFDSEQYTITHALTSSPYESGSHDSQLSPEIKASRDAKSTRAFKYASTYHLTFSLFTSSAAPSAWDVEEALSETVRPLLQQLSSVSEFTVDTQVQLYASFSPSIAGPRYDASSKQWQLQRSDLSGFINAAEWPLNPSIGSGPTINFVLFVPSKDQSPLVLAETGGNSWVIPQWGGVQILNPTGKQPDRLSADDLRPVMLTFADQLSSLLGMPQSPPSLSLRISSLTREMATSLILSASSTLGALSRLTLKLTSIAIPNSVATSVDETIHRLELACKGIQEGHYQSALENARVAEAEAEKAFFEPSMVGQVYFPDEHKVAVYVPLLGPMAVPLVMAAVKELRKLRQRKSKVL